MKSENKLIKNLSVIFSYRKNVRKTAKFLMLTFIFLLIAGECCVCYFTLRANAEKLYLNISRELVSSFSNNISTLITRFNADLAVFSGNPVSDSTEEIVENLKKSRLMLGPGIQCIFYVDEKGWAYPDDESQLPVSVKDRRYYSEIIYNQRDYYFGNKVDSKFYGNPVFHLVKAAYDKNGNRKGFFALEVPVKTIDMNIAENSILKRGNIFITDVEGNFVLRVRSGFISKTYNKSIISDSVK